MPRPSLDPDQVRFRDVFVATESQEMTMVSPEMHETFIMKTRPSF